MARDYTKWDHLPMSLMQSASARRAVREAQRVIPTVSGDAVLARMV